MPRYQINTGAITAGKNKVSLCLVEGESNFGGHRKKFSCEVVYRRVYHPSSENRVFQCRIANQRK